MRDGLAELQVVAERADRTLPRFVLREVEGDLRCGDPREGFARLVCGDCDHHRLIPFTCEGRGFCPSCGERRMADRAARWVDTLLPRVVVRQVVVMVPWPRRWLLARKPDLARGVLAIALREVQRWLQRVGTSQRQGQTGSITVVQRFGGALNLNVHFHALMLDGVYAEDPKTGRLRYELELDWFDDGCVYTSAPRTVALDDTPQAAVVDLCVDLEGGWTCSDGTDEWSGVVQTTRGCTATFASTGLTAEVTGHQLDGDLRGTLDGSGDALAAVDAAGEALTCWRK